MSTEILRECLDVFHNGELDAALWMYGDKFRIDLIPNEMIESLATDVSKEPFTDELCKAYRRDIIQTMDGKTTPLLQECREENLRRLVSSIRYLHSRHDEITIVNTMIGEAQVIDHHPGSIHIFHDSVGNLYRYTYAKFMDVFTESLSDDYGFLVDGEFVDRTQYEEMISVRDPSSDDHFLDLDDALPMDKLCRRLIFPDRDLDMSIEKIRIPSTARRATEVDSFKLPLGLRKDREQSILNRTLWIEIAEETDSFSGHLSSLREIMKGTNRRNPGDGNNIGDDSSISPEIREDYWTPSSFIWTGSGIPWVSIRKEYVCWEQIYLRDIHCGEIQQEEIPGAVFYGRLTGQLVSSSTVYRAIVFPEARNISDIYDINIGMMISPEGIFIGLTTFEYRDILIIPKSGQKGPRLRYMRLVNEWIIASSFEDDKCSLRRYHQVDPLALIFNDEVLPMGVFRGTYIEYLRVVK